MEFLIKKYEGLVRRIASKTNCPGINFEDLCQEGRLAIYNAVKKFDLSKNIKFLTYCYTAVKNNCLTIVNLTDTWNQKINKEAIYFSDFQEENGCDLLDSMGDNDGNFSLIEDNNLLQNALNLLSDNYKEVFSLYLQGLTYNEIADKLNMTHGKVNSLITVAVQKLKKHKYEFSKLLN